ncbi:MAG TPA: lactate utilization protein [Terrisporobacter glycolicus]|uniref:lactate utilization protein n=1 Tax=Terrisporobacter TaxID=1505652 RepID=UPI000E8C0531|nr:MULTISPECIES: lactate utilization protein [Terrisporobacter]MBN9645869.1 lactate utilization protein [Terrisporobacter glycolicus]HBI93161.1 lactate utilization protein [Terrisporobacter hibernicus]
MNECVQWVNEKKIEKTINNLQKNNIKGYYAKSNEEVINIIKDIAKEGEMVSVGGSMTLFETKVIDLLRSGRYNFLDRYEENLTPADMKEIYRKSFYADTYFSSTNAITEEGEIFNVDGNGNRVAAMLYGPDKVVLVVGVNKIVKNIDEALNRNKNISGPANAKRLNTATPCAKVGYCMDCKSDDRICCEYTIIKRQRTKNRMYVIFINDVLGF